jgi:hypothetical protein
MAASPSTGVHRRLRHLRPNTDVVLRFAVDALSVQRTSDGPGWKGTREGRWAVVWTEYSCRRDQVRRCYHRSRLNSHICFRSLVQSFPDASLGISVAVDGQIFQTEVYSASHSPTQSPRPRKLSTWGDRAVVVLIGIRLGIEGVNPIYYETIKVCDSLHIFSRAFDFDVNHEGAVYIPTISWDSRRTSVLFILLRWFSGGQSFLFGPSSYTRDRSIATAHADYH